MNTPTSVMLVLCLTGVVILLSTLMFGLFTDYTTQSSLKHHEEESAPGTDDKADTAIVKLANENHREEAARLYVATHGGTLANARKIVGSGKILQRLALILSVFLLTFILLILSTSTQRIALSTMWIASFILFVALWMKLRNLIVHNRQKLTDGNLPEIDENAWH